jgi:hypothetical protein
MESTIGIEINKTTKKVRVVDTSDYSFPVATLLAKGLGTLRFEGDIVVQRLTTILPLIDLQAGQTASPWFDCVLDSDGAIAYGTYSIDDYSVRTALVNESADAVVAGTGGAGGFTINSLDLSDVLVDGNTITISSSLAGNNGAKTVASVSLVSGNSTIFVDETINAELVPSSNISFDITRQTGSASGVYSGCDQITLSYSFQSDCEQGLNGFLVVRDTTDYGTQVVNSKEITLSYPSWTGEAPVTATNGVVSLSAIATGTYGVVMESNITLSMGGLLITYDATLSDENKVTCSGTLCGLAACIQNLTNVHLQALRSSRVSPYQQFVDGVALNYIQAVEYKKCGEFEKYQEKVQAIKSLLDESGCDCNCCNDDELVWVVNIDPSDNNILTQLEADVAALQETTTTQGEQIATLDGAVTSLSGSLDNTNENVTAILNALPFAYVATASQSGTSAPSLTIGVNQTGLTLTAARTGAGNYTLTSAAPFDDTKVVVEQVATTNVLKRVVAYVESATVIRIQTFDNATGALEDNILLNSKIHILVYP